MSVSYEICVIEGDDAAPEAIRPTVELLEMLDVDVEFVYPPITEYTDDLLAGHIPDPIQDVIERSDTVLFGSARDVHLPIISYLRWVYGSGQFANVRPIRYLPGAASPLAQPDDIDYAIIRENLEGIYYLAEGDLSELASAMPDLNTDRDVVDWPIAELGDGKYALRIITEENTRRLGAFTRRFAERRDRDTVRVTCGTKFNVLAQTDGLFREIIREEVEPSAEVEYEHLIVDDLAQRLVTMPDRFDVIVVPNFSGDVLSDLGAGTIGGLGLAPSGCYGDERAYFEPVHGTAPDIVGENVINPTAAILSAAMMLEYLGENEEATRLTRAVEAVYAAGDSLTPDQGGNASTTEFADAVATRL